MPPVRAVFARLTLVLGLVLLGGCGFTPLYATPGVTPALSHIEVVTAHGRTAFLLSQSLDDAFAHDRESPPAYRLNVTVNERTFSRGLSINNVAERYESHLRVTYELIDLTSGKTIKSDVEPVEVTYASTSQPYAGLAAQQDAEQRAADEAAQRIRTDLAVFFANRATP
jgi:LPS-assembly lipoprotein